jgi:chromosome segregation ATPase
MAPYAALIALFALATLPLAAEAQGATYRCASKEGKKYYGSTIPKQCAGQPVEQLNAQGLVVRRFTAEGEDKDKADKAAELAKRKEQDSAAKEQSRRNRALLATYTSEKDVEEARRRALDDNQKTINEIGGRIENIRKDQARLTKELEFYTGKNKPPAKLTEEIEAVKLQLKAQEGLLLAKRKEIETINARYDDDKKRYAELTRGGGAKK